MIKNKFSFCLILFFKTTLLLSQDYYSLPKDQLTGTGTWRFEHYGNGIIKTSFTPLNLSNNEQVSNAVIISPVLTTSNTKVLLTNNNESIFYSFIKKRLNLIGYFDSAEHKGFRFV